MTAASPDAFRRRRNTGRRSPHRAVFCCVVARRAGVAAVAVRRAHDGLVGARRADAALALLPVSQLVSLLEGAFDLEMDGNNIRMSFADLFVEGSGAAAHAAAIACLCSSA